MPPEEEEIHEEVDPKEDERVFRKAFLDMTEMVRVIYQERNERLEGEGSKLHKVGDHQEAIMMKINQTRAMEEMEAVEIHHPHPHHHHPLLHLQYTSHTSQRTLVKVLF